MSMGVFVILNRLEHYLEHIDECGKLVIARKMINSMEGCLDNVYGRLMEEFGTVIGG